MKAGIPVIARGDTKPTGLTTGSERICRMEGCTGRRIGVRWARGGKKQLTFPCTKGMEELPDGSWRLL